MKILPDKLRPNKKLPIEELKTIICENCGYEFKGHFCPNCGQEVAEFNRPFGFVIYDFMGNFFAFDTRFFRTFWNLLVKPGFLTEEFFKGHRMRYSPPFRIFIFLSFILFLLLQIITEKGLHQTIGKSDFDGKIALGADSLLIINSDTIPLQDIIQKRDSIATEDRTLMGKLDALAVSFEDKMKTTSNPDERRRLKSYIAICRDPEAFIGKFMKYLSWTFFILLPVFALLLKLFYLRRRQYFIRHLMFSIHIHSYLFFLIIIAIALYSVFRTGGGLITSIFLLSFPIYLIIALKRFYGQSIGQVIVKFFCITFIYNIVVLSTVVYVLIHTLGIF